MRSAFAGLAAAALFALAPVVVGDAWLGVGANFLMWLALAGSWAMFSGLSGYVSLGHAVFFGVGAYVMALGWGEIPIALSIAAAGTVAFLLALAVGWPVLRVRGPYFVMLTFGLAELVKFIIIANETRLEQGGRLILGAPSLEEIYWILLLLAIASIGLLFIIRQTRLGAGLRALREDEIAAETIGIPVVRFKLIAFALSAIVPGMVGSVMLMRAGYFEPMNVFDPTISLTIICIAVIGGSDRPIGPVLGAIFLVGLSELLWARLPLLYMVILGFILVGFVLLAPDGIAGLIDRWRARDRRSRMDSPLVTRMGDAPAGGE